MSDQPPDLGALRIDRTRPVKRKPRWRRWLVIGVLVVVAVAGFGWRYATAPVAVEVGSVSLAWPAQGYTLLNATGYVVAQRKASVASKATGRLEWLGVREGSAVTEGEVIARLENRDVTAQMQQAAANVNVARANLGQGEAELKEAERAFKRSEDLLRQNFVAQAAHDTALSRLDKAKANIASLQAAIAAAEAAHRNAQVALDQTLIRAPFTGVVLTKNANVGDNITPFSAAADTKGAVLTMADMATLEVEADVSESNIGKVKVGQPCEIQLDALPDVRLHGNVSRLVPTVDRSKATVLVKIRFTDPDPRVLPEMSAKVAFLGKEVATDERTPRLALQAGAVVQRDGRSVVYLVASGRARETAVTTGGKIGDLVEVTSGVKAGDKVVLRPSDQLRDGAAVTVAAK
ncbi:MAG: efflux RND transporter periplasmic adaptor subunit [Burkholderiales bacterium]